MSIEVHVLHVGVELVQFPQSVPDGEVTEYSVHIGPLTHLIHITVAYHAITCPTIAGIKVRRLKYGRTSSSSVWKTKSRQKKLM